MSDRQFCSSRCQNIEHKFHCHKLLLSVASPVFRQMFLSLPSSSSYVLDTASPEAFQRLLDFIYTKKPYRVHQGGSGSEIQVVKLVLDVLGLANRFKICQLVVHCERVVESLLVTSDNCQDVREILCSSTNISDKARNDLIRKYRSLVRSIRPSLQA